MRFESNFWQDSAATLNQRMCLKFSQLAKHTGVKPYFCPGTLKCVPIAHMESAPTMIIEFRISFFHLWQGSNISRVYIAEAPIGWEVSVY